ncbi:hypothetical protein [Arthrobacter sp. 35W]|uniref:hypothetical protein n=1 Tax=Arthrobacter sp. 35W TaxID=1132441 RepID=UPI00040AF974|nr:hypothetical protein [Arthrobacter sp. 35W]
MTKPHPHTNPRDRATEDELKEALRLQADDSESEAEAALGAAVDDEPVDVD